MAKISSDLGKAFETAGENKLVVLKQQRIITWWDHAQPELYSLGMVKRGGRFVQAWGKGKPSGADFSGIVSQDGKSFAIEFKSIGPKEGRDGSLILEADDHFSPMQRHHLDAALEANAHPFLAVQFRLLARPWFAAVIPWNEVPWERATKLHHLRAEAAEPWRIPMDAVLFEHLLGRRHKSFGRDSDQMLPRLTPI